MQHGCCDPCRLPGRRPRWDRAGRHGQRIAGVEVVEVDLLARTDSGPVMSGQMTERAARPPVRLIANEAGDSAPSLTVVMTLRLAPPDWYRCTEILTG